jgi:Transglycosylase SLT domain
MPRRASLRSAVCLLFGRMRNRLALATLAAFVGGCASMRGVTPLPTIPVKPPSVTAIPPPAPPASQFDRLAHRHIDVWEHRLRTQPALREATEDSLARGAAYLPRLCAILGQYGLPADLALLPVVESGFWPTARGRSGERGLWQLRRATARRFGLIVNTRRDDRLHPERATRAAARYLALLYARYEDWPLALAAYNAGERRVDRALARERSADFWRLADHGLLPRTSRDYVPHFLAVVRVTRLGSSSSSQVACGEVAMKMPVAARVPPSPPLSQAQPSRRLSFSARRLPTPQGHASEAGVTYPLSERIAVQMSFHRDAFGRSVPRETENGVITNVRVGF